MANSQDIFTFYVITHTEAPFTTTITALQQLRQSSYLELTMRYKVLIKYQNVTTC